MQRLVVDGGSGGGWIGDVSDLGTDLAMALPWGRVPKLAGLGVKGVGKAAKALSSGSKALKAGSSATKSRHLPMGREPISGAWSSVSRGHGKRFETADDMADMGSGRALPRDAGKRFAAGTGGAVDELHNLRWAVFDDIIGKRSMSSAEAADWVKRADFDMLTKYLRR